MLIHRHAQVYAFRNVLEIIRHRYNIVESYRFLHIVKTDLRVLVKPVDDNLETIFKYTEFVAQ